MKKMIICVAAALAIGAVACGKSASVALCEKKADCAKTDPAACSSSSTSSSSTAKCVAEADALANCYVSNGTCVSSIFPGNALDVCKSELAASLKCLAGG